MQVCRERSIFANIENPEYLLAKKHIRVLKENHLRRMVKDAISLTTGKSHYFIFTETDITELFTSVQKNRQSDSRFPGLTAHLVKTLVDTLGEFPELNSMRKGEDRIVRYSQVDVFMPVERDSGGEYIIYPSIIRAADTLSVREINEKIQFFRSPEFEPLTKEEIIFLKLPAFLRRLYLRYALRSPERYRTLFGTTSFSSVGRVSGERMWPIGNPLRCLELYAGNTVENRKNDDKYSVTIDLVFAIDHTIVDGAYGLRFINSFSGKLKSLKGE